MNLILHDYWRSSAAYRVRIALNLKGLGYVQVAHDLRAGAQHDPSYVALAPQGRVPALEADGVVLTQSLAIMEWLDEVQTEPPLLPADPADRAIVRAMAALIACDIHPFHNLSTLRQLRTEFGASEAKISAWIGHWVSEGFTALEELIVRHGGGFAFGDRPTMADCCLVPQVFGAQRFEVDLRAYPRIRDVHERCANLPAFRQAHPSLQADADSP